jgi:hypothetical protein
MFALVLLAASSNEPNLLDDLHCSSTMARLGCLKVGGVIDGIVAVQAQDARSTQSRMLGTFSYSRYLGKTPLAC